MNSELLPDWVVWSPRSFPDTNLLLLAGQLRVCDFGAAVRVGVAANHNGSITTAADAVLNALANRRLIAAD